MRKVHISLAKFLLHNKEHQLYDKNHFILEVYLI